jgi:hypothetical protein
VLSWSLQQKLKPRYTKQKFSNGINRNVLISHIRTPLQ